jgi:hypothetical protein
MGERAGPMVRIDLRVLAEYADSILSPLNTVDALQGAIEATGARLGKTAN